VDATRHANRLQGKARKIKEKGLGFPWIPLAESGLFNGLGRIQIKNFSFSAKTRSGCERRQLRSSARDMDLKGPSSLSRDHSPHFGFRQENGGY
jgi:hypothetical protein